MRGCRRPSRSTRQRTSSARRATTRCAARRAPTGSRAARVRPPVRPRRQRRPDGRGLKSTAFDAAPAATAANAQVRGIVAPSCEMLAARQRRRQPPAAETRPAACSFSAATAVCPIVEPVAQAIRGLRRQVAMDADPHLLGRAGDDPARPLVLLHVLRPVDELVRDGGGHPEVVHCCRSLRNGGDASGTVAIRSIAFTYLGERCTHAERGSSDREEVARRLSRGRRVAASRSRNADARPLARAPRLGARGCPPSGDPCRRPWTA